MLYSTVAWPAAPASQPLKTSCAAAKLGHGTQPFKLFAINFVLTHTIACHRGHSGCQGEGVHGDVLQTRLWTCELIPTCFLFLVPNLYSLVLSKTCVVLYCWCTYFFIVYRTSLITTGKCRLGQGPCRHIYLIQIQIFLFKRRLENVAMNLSSKAVWKNLNLAFGIVTNRYHCSLHKNQNWTYLLSASHRSLLHGLNPTARKLTTSIQLKNLTTSGIMAQLESEISPVTWSAVYSAKMSNVSVCVRFRPLNARESLRDSGTACIQRLDDKSLTFMVIMRTRPRHRNVTFTSSAAIDFTKSLKITGCAYWQMT